MHDRPRSTSRWAARMLGEWFLYPERPAIIIGTQDMLLSRALNRGYASARARWPMEFGLLNHDALWVMDEVQLMDVGLATSAQLQAFREQDRGKRLRPCHTWWMSATLQPEWLRSVDTAPASRELDSRSVHGRAQPSAAAACGTSERRSTIESIGPEDDRGVRGTDSRRSMPTFRPANMVESRSSSATRLIELAERLTPFAPPDGLKESSWFTAVSGQPSAKVGESGFLSRSACSRDVDRIIVATQVVEAGVDISAGCLITELAPWPSLVQRFGAVRDTAAAARYSWSIAAATKPAPPLSARGTRECLGIAPGLKQDVGIAALESHEESLSPEARARLYPFAPAHLLLRREFDELFDTTPDLTGADLDISRFIRSGDERDLQVFWLDVAKERIATAKRRPQRRELCAVPFLKARDWLCGEETKTNRKPKLRNGIRAWVWDWIDGEWSRGCPGEVCCPVASSASPRHAVAIERIADSIRNRETPCPPVPSPAIPRRHAGTRRSRRSAGRRATEFQRLEDDRLPHLGSGRAKPGKIADELGLARGSPRHPRTGGTLARLGQVASGVSRRDARHPDRPARSDLAKGPKERGCGRRACIGIPDDSDERPAFRHELASALGLFAILRAYAPQHPALLGPWSEVFAKLGKSPSLRRTTAAAITADSTAPRLLAGRHSICWCIWSPAITARFVSPCTRPPRTRNTATGTGEGCRFAASAKGIGLPSVALIPGEPATTRGLAHPVAGRHRAFDTNGDQLAGTLPRLAGTLRAGGLGVSGGDPACGRRSGLATEDQRSGPGIGGQPNDHPSAHLKGCSPAPLANYLKALGILRLVGEQADKQARGWWQGEQFCLLTKLSQEELEAFFLERYEPTPLLSPWNKGCGFFKANDPGLVPLENSRAARFERFRAAVAESRKLLDAVAHADAVIRAIKARTKTNKTFQSEEQRQLLASSETYRRCLDQLQTAVSQT